MHKQLIVMLIGSVSLLFAQHSHAISVEALDQAIKNSKSITIIDVRINLLYQKGHILNAINIPATLIEHKRLPALGEVVVYGDGIEEEVVEQAVAQLNLKTGIVAEELEGGYTAWSARHNIVQRKAGLDVSATKYITYNKLKEMTSNRQSSILLDLRTDTKVESLATHFPDTRIKQANGYHLNKNSDIKVDRKILRGIPKNNRHILVLIDDGNGLSEKVANKLHAAGVKRLVILTGGERALQSQGEIVEQVHRAGD